MSKKGRKHGRIPHRAAHDARSVATNDTNSMAKTPQERSNSMTHETTTNDSAVVPAEPHITDITENLGRLLQTAERKAKEWLAQRQTLAQRVTEIRDTADHLLRELSIGDTPSARAGRRVVAGTRGKSRKKRTMSPSQRRAVSERMRKYWAERRGSDRK